MRSSFWSYAATITITSLGGFLPSIYLPTYAADLGLSRSTGTLLIILMNGKRPATASNGTADMWALSCQHFRTSRSRLAQRPDASQSRRSPLMLWRSCVNLHPLRIRYKRACPRTLCDILGIDSTRLLEPLDPHHLSSRSGRPYSASHHLRDILHAQRNRKSRQWADLKQAARQLRVRPRSIRVWSRKLRISDHVYRGSESYRMRDGCHVSKAKAGNMKALDNHSWNIVQQ